MASKPRDLIPHHVSFDANSFVAHHLNELRRETPNDYNDALNAAVQRFARSQAINHFYELLYNMIQRELRLGHETRFQFYDTMDFALDDMEFVTKDDRGYFNRQDGKCEGKPKGWKGWPEIVLRVHRRLNGKTVTCEGEIYRIVKRRDRLHLTKLGRK